MSFLSRFKKSAREEERSHETPAPKAISPERYRSADLAAFPVGNDSELVYSKADRSAHILPSYVAEWLRQCQTFASLEDHTRERCRALGFGQAEIDAVRSQLVELAEAGLLISRSDLLNQSRHPVDARNVPKAIASVGIVTCNRVESLKRCLESYIANCKHYGRTNDFVVMDDSESVDARNGTREMLRSLKARSDAQIRYGGLEEKLRFAEALAREAGVPSEVAHFALFDTEGCGYSPGANQNALLLHTVGDSFFRADDDTVCRVVAVPESHPGLSFVSRTDPTEFWFFPDREKALQSVTFAEKDLLAIHEELLGRELGDCLARSSENGEVGFDQMRPGFLRNLQSGKGRVLVTLNGLVGDSGMGSPLYLLLLAGPSRERLLHSESAYRAGCASREVLRTVRCTTISEGTFCVGAFLAFDNRAMLPPFFPVQRNEDGIFGFTLRRCFENGYFGFLPWALLHAPVEPRSFSAEDLWKNALGLGTSQIVIACMLSLEEGAPRVNGNETLRALGKHLTELGSLPLPDFEEFLRLQRWAQASSDISLFEERLRTYGESPGFWASDVRSYLDHLREALLRDDYIVPRDLIEGRSISEARELTQRLVLKFGRLLQAWPEMVEGAKSLREKGQRLGELM